MNFSLTTNVLGSPVVALVAQTPSQSTSPEPNRLMSSTLEGFFVFLLFSIFIAIGIGYRQHCRQRDYALQQQIETLERIWKMTPQRDK
jgi:hypothetical protein